MHDNAPDAIFSLISVVSLKMKLIYAGLIKPLAFGIVLKTVTA